MSKIVMIPYDQSGNMLNYSYDEFPHTSGPQPSPFFAHQCFEWRPAEQLELSLVLVGLEKGRSRLTSWWKDEAGCSWPMFFVDLEKIISERKLHQERVRGTFLPGKRGSSYGLKVVSLV